MEVQTLDTDIKSLVATAKGVQITDAATYSTAGEIWNVARGLRAQVAETFDGIIAKAHAAHKEAVAQKKRFDDPLDQAQRHLKLLMITYDQEQERLRRLEQARLEAEAKRKAEEEALQLATELEKAGLNHEAEAVIASPETPPVVAPPKATPKVEGFRYRTVWRFKIVDANLIPRQYLIPDEETIGKIVRAMKSETKIPGISAYEDKV